LDIREHILTDTNYRYAKLNWEISQRRLELAFSEIDTQIVITQGFLGATTMGHTTTLGREGSDFTAAALAYMLDAKQVTVWKDVDGVYNADPKCYEKPQKLDEISYNEAIELAFFGAQVIHPKTIKPLQNKNIPLFVRSFLDTELQGTTIHDIKGHLELPPIFIHKKEQVLISIQPNDFSFIVEENLSKIFATFAQNGIRTNLMQNAAISFSACFDYRAEKLDKLLDDLRANFIVKYNLGLELITIRHYTQAAMDEMTIGRNVYLTQRSRHTVRFVLK
jgi:aspartate kinase